MNNNKIPINQQFAAIDVLYWNMLQGNDFYNKSAEVSGVIYIEEDKKKLLDDLEAGINEGLAFEDIRQTVDFGIDNAVTGALLSGEEKGFILGFLYAAQMGREIDTGRDLARSEALDKLKRDIEAGYE